MGKLDVRASAIITRREREKALRVASDTSPTAIDDDDDDDDDDDSDHNHDDDGDVSMKK